MPVKISELELKPVLDGTEQVEINDVGVTKKATTAGIAALASGGSTGGVQSVTGTLVDDTDPDNPVINSQDLASVLVAGNDAGGLGIQNIGSIQGDVAIQSSGVNFTRLALSEDAGLDVQTTSGTKSTILQQGGSQIILNSIDGGDSGSFNLSEGTLSITANMIQILIDKSTGVAIDVSQQSGARIKMIGLPTSSAGLTSGMLWRNGNAINIIP